MAEKTFQERLVDYPAQAGNGLQEKNEIEVVEKYDIVADRQQMNAELVNSKEVDDIVSTIEVGTVSTCIFAPDSPSFMTDPFP